MDKYSNDRAARSFAYALVGEGVGKRVGVSDGARLEGKELGSRVGMDDGSSGVAEAESGPTSIVTTTHGPKKKEAPRLRRRPPFIASCYRTA